MSHYINSKINRRPEVLKRFGISNTTLHNHIKAHLMPPPISLGARSVGWIEHELDQVLNAMIAGKPPEHIRALVNRIVGQRQNSSLGGAA